ncbi:CHAP domain-containing protein [Lactovum odontotermitis]
MKNRTNTRKHKSRAGRLIAGSALLALLSSPILETAVFAEAADDTVVNVQQQPENLEKQDEIKAATNDKDVTSASPQVSEEDYENAKALIEKGDSLAPKTKAVAGITQAEAINWARNLVGQSIDIDGNGAECVDVTMAYGKYLFGNQYSMYGNGSQYANRGFDGFNWISASQTNPQPGDIVVWTGGNGHVGIVIAASGTNFTTVEQNVSGNRSVQTYGRNKDGLRDANGTPQPFAGVQRPNYRASATVQNITNAVHRLYNPNNGDHYYTTNTAGAQNLVNVGWHYDGIFFYQTSGNGRPVYVIYNPNSGEHFYTADFNEARSLSSAGWQNQGIAWYAPDTGSPVYRLYNPNPRGFHFWTTSDNEKNGLVAAGWRYEGISFYG